MSCKYFSTTKFPQAISKMTLLRRSVSVSKLHWRWCRCHCDHAAAASAEFTEQILECAGWTPKNFWTYSRWHSCAVACWGCSWPYCRHHLCCFSTPCSIRARLAGSVPAADHAQPAAEGFWCGAWPARFGAYPSPDVPLLLVADPSRLWRLVPWSSRWQRAVGPQPSRGWTSWGRGRTRWSGEVDRVACSRLVDPRHRLR